MRGARYRFLTALLGMCAALYPFPAAAWEFEMEGAFNWSHQAFAQQGVHGFFGPYNVDRGIGTTTAPLNFWNSGLMERDFSSGANARWSFFNVKFQPTIKINEAIRARAQYRIGQYGDPTADNDYVTQNAPGVDTAISDGKWTLFWMTAQTPGGIFGIGKRRWLFGNGLQYDGWDSASTESILLSVPFGPFQFGIGFYPYRFAGSAQQPPFLDPYDLAGFQYYNRSDASGSFFQDFLGFVTYGAGSFQCGVTGVYGSFHIGPESQLGPNPHMARDSEMFHGSAFARFNNGRLFFNSEGAWMYWTDRFSGPSATGNAPNPRYIEQWRLMTEFGFCMGPAKLTFFYAWQPGPDRRNGAFIGKQPAAFVWHPTFDRFLGNVSVFRPYAYLFGYSYGSGLGAFDFSVNGFVRDASSPAVRLDYAVAANLIVSISGFWAERTSHGYGWGCIGPNDIAFNGVANDGNLSINFNGAPGSPNIPERDLGWEIDTGFQWMMLEGWQLSGVLGIWQPGKWFSYACIDRSVPGWNVPTPLNSFGTKPGKQIDPVIGGDVSITFLF